MCMGVGRMLDMPGADARRVAGIQAVGTPSMRGGSSMSAGSTAPDAAETGHWWDLAACAGNDPEWWGDDRAMRPMAVRICLGCPVREPCLTEAVARGDLGVVRGGMLMVEVHRRSQTISLVCAHCHVQPVRATRHGHARYCSSTCQSAASRRNRERRLAA